MTRHFAVGLKSLYLSCQIHLCQKLRDEPVFLGGLRSKYWPWPVLLPSWDQAKFSYSRCQLEVNSFFYFLCLLSPSILRLFQLSFPSCCMGSSFPSVGSVICNMAQLCLFKERIDFSLTGLASHVFVSFSLTCRVFGEEGGFRQIQTHTCLFSFHWLPLLLDQIII